MEKQSREQCHFPLNTWAWADLWREQRKGEVYRDSDSVMEMDCEILLKNWSWRGGIEVHNELGHVF
jgi:hypothetical protein